MPFETKNKMKKLTIVTLAFCAAMFASCGKTHTAKSTVKDFMSEYFNGDDYSIDYFSELDSTTYVTDTMIEIMRANAEKNGDYKKGIKYAERKGKMLLYIPVTLEKGKEKVKHTFYMTGDATAIVAFK